MIYVTRKTLECAKKKAWQLEFPWEGPPYYHVDPSVHSFPGEITCFHEVPVIKDGLGISAKRFPNIKGADLFY